MTGFIWISVVGVALCAGMAMLLDMLAEGAFRMKPVHGSARVEDATTASCRRPDFAS